MDLSKITADTIINWKSEYKLKNDKYEEITIRSDKLESLENEDIVTILKHNLKEIFISELTGIDKTNFIEKTTLFLTKSITRIKLGEYITFLSEISDAELENIVNLYFVNKAINTKIEWKTETDSKKFTVTTEILDWDKVNENDNIKNEFDKDKKIISAILNLTDTLEKNLAFQELSRLFSQEVNQAIYLLISQIFSQEISHEASQINRYIQENGIKKFVDCFAKIYNIAQQVHFDSIKSMYDRIKGKTATIEIALTDTQS